MYDDQEFYNSLLNQYAALAMNKNAKVIRQRVSKKKEIQRKASKGRHLIYNVRAAVGCDRRFIPNCRISALPRSTPRLILMCSSCSPLCLERQRIELPCFSSSCLVCFPSLFYTRCKTKPFLGRADLCHRRQCSSFTTPRPVIHLSFLFRRPRPALEPDHPNQGLFRTGPPPFEHRVRQRAIQPGARVHIR